MSNKTASSEFKQALIEAVKPYTWLWQNSHKDFKDNVVIKRSFAEIGRELGQTGSTKTETVLVGSVTYGTMCCSGLIGGALFNYLGCHITMSIGSCLSTTGYILSSVAPNITLLTLAQMLVGLGFGLALVPTVAVQSLYFERWRYFAVSFVNVGSGLGTLIFPRLFLFLADRYGWRGSMLLNAGVTMQLLVCASLMKSKPTHSNPSMLLRLVFLCCSCVLWAGCCCIFYSIINALMVSRGVTEENSATFVAVSGCFSLMGRAVFAFVVQAIKRHTRILVYIISCMIGSLGTVGIVHCETDTQFLIAVAVCGFSFGVILPGLNGTVIDLFGCENLAVLTGYCTFSSGIGGLTMPYIAGRIMDQTDSLCNGMWFAAGLAFASSAVGLSIFIKNKQRKIIL